MLDRKTDEFEKAVIRKYELTERQVSNLYSEGSQKQWPQIEYNPPGCRPVDWAMTNESSELRVRVYTMNGTFEGIVIPEAQFDEIGQIEPLLLALELERTQVLVLKNAFIGEVSNQVAVIARTGIQAITQTEEYIPGLPLFINGKPAPLI